MRKRAGEETYGTPKSAFFSLATFNRLWFRWSKVAKTSFFFFFLVQIGQKSGKLDFGSKATSISRVHGPNCGGGRTFALKKLQTLMYAYSRPNAWKCRMVSCSPKDSEKTGSLVNLLKDHMGRCMAQIP